MENEIEYDADNAVIAVADLHRMQFDWMSRLSRVSGTACFVINTDLDIVFFDPTLLSLLELPTEDDLTGAPLIDIVAEMGRRGDFGPGDPTIFCELLRAELTRPSPSHSDTPRKLSVLTPSGRRLQFQQDLNLDGYFLLTCKDITERHIQKQALRVALESSRSGYVIYDIESDKYRIEGKPGKRSSTETFGQQLVENGLRSLLHADDVEKVTLAFEGGLRSQMPWSVIFRVLDSDGQTIWMKTHATPQISESGIMSSFIFFYTEVTAQLRVQDDLRQAKEQSEKALSAKNAFLGRLSHEIRTPMNAVVGIADALIHHNGNPEIEPKLELIQSSAEKIIRIVDDSLNHTKLEEDKLELDPEPASPRASVEAVCALWEQKAIKNGIDLTFRIDSAVPETIVFDHFRYEQCLNNLMSNAVKFSPGGRIQVVMTTLEKGDRNSLVLAVKDNGIGMSPSQQESLFEAYTQADKSISNRYGGTGLGMNITKQIMDLMGGSISVRSTAGEGTMIALILPIEVEKEAEASTEMTSDLVDTMLDDAIPAKSDYSHLRLLVVDDNPTNHIVVSSLLESLVDKIDLVADGELAIEQLQRETYDLVLMDIHMPVMDGIEATLAIRGSKADYANVPIIALTADPQYQQKRLCRNIGMDDALAKPVKLTEILSAIDRVLARRQNESLAA